MAWSAAREREREHRRRAAGRDGRGVQRAAPARRAPARTRTQAEVQSHEVVVHRVDGLRVTPHWTHGDTLELDVALTHAAPTASRATRPRTRARSRDIDFHSTVQASFDEWLTVASVGEGGDELQIRVTWR